MICVVQGGAVKLPALTYPVRRRRYILLFKFRLFVCASLCPIDDMYLVNFVLYNVYPPVVGSHMVGHMFNNLSA